MLQALVAGRRPGVPDKEAVVVAAHADPGRLELRQLERTPALLHRVVLAPGQRRPLAASDGDWRRAVG